MMGHDFFIASGICTFWADSWVATKMKGSRKADVGVTGGSVRRTQKGMAVMPASPGKTYTGRVVQCEAVTVQTPGQMAAATSDAASRRRIAGNYAVAAESLSSSSRKTAHDETSRAFEIQECAYNVKDSVRKQVRNALETLERVWEEYDGDSVARCAAVAKEMNSLKRDFKITDVEDVQYKFMACQLGPHYTDELDSALTIIKSRTDRQYGWGYHKEIILIGKYLELQSSGPLEHNRKLLKDIYLKVLNFELEYMEFMKDSPLKLSVNYSEFMIKELLENGGRAENYKFIDPEDEDHIKKEKERLVEIIKANLGTGVTDQDAESLRRDVIGSPDDMMIRRRYHDFLRCQFLEQRDEYQKKRNATTTESLDFFKEVLALRDKCISELNELDLLPRKIAAEITQKVKMFLARSLDSGVRLEEEMLNFIDDMVNNGVVSKEYADILLCCKDLEFLPKPAITVNPQESELIKSKFLQEIDVIFKIFSGKDATDMLKQLFHKPEYKLKIETQTLDEQEKKAIANIKKKLRKKLFDDLIGKFYENRDKPGLEKKKLAEMMRQLRLKLTEQIPYTFVIDSWDGRAKLANTACGAWYCDIKKLSTAESFRKEDIDCLLDLKRLAPHVPNKDLWIVLEKTLANFFQVVLRDTGEIPAEEIEVLSQWVDGLSRVKCIGEQLKTNHELWKRTHGGAASARDTGLPDTPSTSAEVFDIDQAARKSVALKRSQITTASVTSDQAVSQAALVQSGSQKSSTVKSEASSMPTAKASTVNTPKTGVFFPESQGNIKRDTSCTFGTNDNKEEPRAPVPANTETVTTRASQAVSPLRDADQPSSRADRYRLQSAVTTSAENMTADGKMASHKVDSEVAGRGMQETQRGTEASPGTHTGSVVQCEAVTIQTPDQAAAISDTTSRRTTSDGYAVTVPGAETSKETAIAGKSSTVETEKHAYHVEEELLAEVAISLQTLEREQKKHKEEPLLLCLAAVRELDRLLNKFKIDKGPESRSYQFVASQLRPHYEHSLHQALETLKSETDTQCGWKHHKNLMSIMRYLDLQTNKSLEWVKKEMVCFCQQLIQSEVNYLEFVKDCPVAGIGSEHLDIIEQLLSSLSELPDCCRDFIDEEHVDALKKDKERLATVIQSRTDNDSADEHIKKLAENTDSETPDIRLKRLYSDLLKIRLSELRRQSEKQRASEERESSIRKCLLIVKELCELHNICVTRVNEFHFTCDEIKASISGIAKAMMKKGINNAIRLDDEVMNFIGGLRSRKLLSPTCVIFYLRYREFQSIVESRTTVQEDKITEYQCGKRFEKIFSLLDKKTRTAFLEAAEMLMQLQYWHGDEIRVMSMKEEHIANIRKIRKTLCENLFVSVIEELKEHDRLAKGDFDKNADYTSQYRPVLAELNPYLFVADDIKYKTEWMKSACAVWFRDLEKLVQKESFNEKDIDCLLALKQVVPEVSNPPVRVVLGNVLEHLLSNIMEHGYGDIPLEKVMAISQWIDDLAYIKDTNSRQKEIDDTNLKELNEALKETWKNDATPGVVPDYVSGAALVQPESKEPLIARSKASPASTTEPSSAKVAKTGIVFPKGWESIERDESLQFIQEDELVQVATDTETATTRASQATSFSQGAGRC